jgi:amino acid transporter
MPEESINIFISNIYSIAIFIAIVLFIFIILFLTSRFFIYNRKNKELFHKLEQSGHQTPKSLTVGKYSGFHLNKDIYLAKNLFVFGIVFILVIFFILLLLLALNFTAKFQMGGGLFLIIGIVFLIIFTAVYFVKSKFITK